MSSWKNTVNIIRGDEKEERSYSDVIADDKLFFYEVVEQEIDKALTAENIRPILDSIALFGKNHSTANCIAIIAQKRDAKLVKRYEVWADEHQTVNSNARGIILLTADPSGHTFLPYRVFDVSETSLKEVPSRFMRIDTLNASLIEILQANNINVVLIPPQQETVAGYIENNQLRMHENIDDYKAFITLTYAYASLLLKEESNRERIIQFATYIFTRRSAVPNLPSLEEYEKYLDLQGNLSKAEVKKDLNIARSLSNRMSAQIRDIYIMRIKGGRNYEHSPT